jgi:DNA-binding PucR family transcriptional regulator
MASQLTAEHTHPTATDLLEGLSVAVDEAVLRHAVSASAALRRSEDPDYVLDILTSTARLVVPTAAVWAVRESPHAAPRQAAAFDSTSAFGAACAAPAVDLMEVLEALSERIGAGRFPFDVDTADTPFALAIDAPYRPQSLTVFPLSSPDARGALVVSVPGDGLSPSYRSVIALLCDRASAALELANARAAAQHTEALFDTLTQLSASYSDADLVLDRIVRSAVDLLHTDAAWVMLADEEKQRLNVSTVCGITSTSFFEASCGTDEWLCGAAIRKRRVVCVPDLHAHDQAKYSKIEGLRSTMCAPLFVEDELVGVLMAAHREICDPSPEDRRIMGALASAAAVSIGNARLYAGRESSIARLGHVNDLLEERSEALERTIRFQQRLTELVLAGNGLDDLVGTVTEALGCRVLILDRDLVVLHGSTAADDDLDAAALRQAIRSSEETSTDTGVSRLAVELGERSVQALVAPLDLAGERTAYVVVLEGEDCPDGTDLGMTEAAVTAIGLELMRDRATAEAEARVTGGLFQALLSGDDVDEATMMRRASYLGFELAGQNVVIAAAVGDDGANGKSGGQLSVQGAIQRAVRRHWDAPTPVFERDDAVFVLVSDPEEVSPALIKEQCRLIKRALEISGRTAGVRIAYAGPHSGIAGVRRAVAEAEYALQVQGVLDKNGAPVAFGELGVWTLLGRVGNRDHLSSFAQSVLGELLTHDADRQTQLVDTLRVLIKCNFHYRSAAEALYAHPNTIRYRMSRIATLTGLDLTDGDDRLKVELALRILDVIDPAHATPAG